MGRLATVKSVALAKNRTSKGEATIRSFLYGKCDFKRNALEADFEFLNSIKSGNESVYLKAIRKNILRRDWYLILIDAERYEFNVFNFKANQFSPSAFKSCPSNPDEYFEIKIKREDGEFTDVNSGINFNNIVPPITVGFAKIPDEEKPTYDKDMDRNSDPEKHKKIYGKYHAEAMNKKASPVRIIKEASVEPTLSTEDGTDNILSILGLNKNSAKAKEQNETEKRYSLAEEVDDVVEDAQEQLQKEKEVVLDEKQREIYDLIANTNDNIFIQGRAGTGKSEIINHLQKNTNKSILCTAFTGIAAEKINGTTINSLFKIGPAPFYDPKRYDMVADDSPVRFADTIIIDEVSMLRPDMLDTIDRLCKIARNNGKPFGGIQMVFVGDLYQLPPIIKFEDCIDAKTKKKIKKEEFEDEMYRRYGPKYASEGKYKHYFFFDSEAYKKADFKFEKLTKVYRQVDAQMLENLDNISKEQNLDEAIDYFNSCVVDNPEEYEQKDITILSPWKPPVDEINEKRLEELEGEEKKFPATNHWNSDGEEDELPSEKELRLKVGAYVIFCKNDSGQSGRYVNGTKGKIVDFYKDEEGEKIKVEVLSKDNKYYGESILIERARWDKLIYTKNPETGKLELINDGKHYFIQFPLKLAYAMTIHKSQGQTLDEAFIKIARGSVWDHGQLYVALSRVKELKGIHLDRELTENDVHCDVRVKKFLKDTDEIDTAEEEYDYQTDMDDETETDESYNLTNNVAMYQYCDENYGKAKNRIERWSRNPSQINHQIIWAFFKAEEDNKYVTKSKMRELFMQKGFTEHQFYNNFGSMCTDRGNSHGKIFEDDGNRVRIWSYVKNELLNYKEFFYKGHKVDELENTDNSETSKFENGDISEKYNTELEEVKSKLASKESEIEKLKQEIMLLKQQGFGEDKDRKRQGELHKEIEKIFNQFNLSIYLKGIPRSERLKELHKKYIQTKDQTVSKQINEMYEIMGVDMDLYSRAECISNESYREKAKRLIEEFYNISKRNVDKGKSRI